jgi:hypothetical protein
VTWEYFKDCDPGPLQKFAVTEQIAYASRNQPSAAPCSGLSALQNYVKSARKSIVEPVFATLETFSDTENDDLSAKPTFRSYLHTYRPRSTYASGGLTLATSRPRDNTGQVILRSDVKEENTDALITVDTHEEDNENIKPRGKQLPYYPPDPTPPFPSSPAQKVKTSTAKLRQNSKAHSKPPRANLITTKLLKPKGKTDSYKQAWSNSEQDLLERLLDEIPDGTKNRFVV